MTENKKSKKPVKFNADFLKVSGPNKSDGSYTVMFQTGEYEKGNMIELMKLIEDLRAYEVTVK